METVSAFLPVDRRHALARRKILPDRTDGAVLFADISGFTHLTDVLERELGPKRGAEEISIQLDRIYGVMIAPVHAYAGSVISFSGDAITCWFDDHPIGAQVRESGAIRATACALAMQTVIREMGDIKTPAGHSVSLAIKVSLAAGMVRRFLLGPPGEQRFEVLAGNLVDRTASAEQFLRPGETAVDAEIVQRFGAALNVREWRSSAGDVRFAVISEMAKEVAPTPWLEIPAVDTDVASGWLLRPVYERLRSIEGQFLAELRPAVTFFLSFDGINYERDEGAGQKLYDFVSWVQTILARYGGYLLQLIIGDKGSYCFIVFGALHAHEDDAVRAIAAAATLRQLPQDISFIQNVRIGISSGVLHVGAYGSQSRRTFGVIGNETNVAARLMSAARPGQILVSSKVAEAAEHEFRFEDLGHVELKGLARPVPILSVVRRRLQPHANALSSESTGPSVGRDAELARLHQSLKALQAGESNSILIEGEPGIGKSQLLTYFLEQAVSDGIPILVGAGDAIEQSTPYFAWRPIFRSVFGIAERDSPETVRQKVLARFPDDLQHREFLPLLDTVLPLQLGDNALTAQMTGEARANSTNTLLLHLLSSLSLSGGYLILAFDDAHWLDSSSATLLAQARRVLHPVLFIIVTRPTAIGDATPTEYERLITASNLEHLKLNALSQEQTRDLICKRLGVTEVSRAIISFIYNHSEGHPFFSEEIAYALRDTGYIRIENGRCTLAGGADRLLNLDFPVTIQGVVTSRIDRLESSHQLTLKVASVLGRVFAVSVLHHIYPFPTVVEQLPAQLSTLERLDIILPDAPPPEPSYIFKHNITQEVIYSLMTFSQRQQLHERAAQWYESRYAEDLSPYYPLLAHHWSKAENARHAIYYLDKAGEQALRNFANQEAIRFFSQALDVDKTAGYISSNKERALWEIKIGEAYVHWTRYAEGQEHLERGLSLLNMLAPYTSSPLRNGFLTLGAMLRQLIHRIQPRRFLQRRETDSIVLLAASRAYSRLVEVYFHSGKTLLSTHAAFHTLNLAELAGNSPELAEAYAPVGAFFSFLRLHGTARAYFDRALNVADDVDSPSARSFVLLAKATYETGIARWQRAEASIDELIESGQRIGAQRRYNDGLQLKTILLYTRGHFQECLQVGEKLLISARQLNDRRFQGYGLFALSFANFHLGHVGAATEQLDELRAILVDKDAVTDRQLTLNVHGLWCLVHLQRGNLQNALDAAGRATRSSGSPFQVNYWTLPGYVGPAEVYLSAWEIGHVGDSDDLQRESMTAVRSLVRFARTFPIGHPAAKLYGGWFQQLHGRPQRALRLWEQGLDHAQKMGLEYERGRLHYELSRSLALVPAQSHEHVRHARAHFQAIGSAHGLHATVDNTGPAVAGPFFTSAAMD